MTNDGSCINFNSICPIRYKEGVIKTYLHRAFTISSSWDNFNTEVNNIKQLLVNNNFPMRLIDNTVKNFLNNKFSETKNSNNLDKINIYFRNQMTSDYRIREERIKAIIKKNVQPMDSRNKICLNVYYKNLKLKEIIIKNNCQTKSQEETNNVVYQYTCPNVGCSTVNNSYIGYTTNMLKTRLRQHSYNGSIKLHQSEVHKTKITYTEIISNTKILHKNTNKTNLLLLEALTIKNNAPQLNR